MNIKLNCKKTFYSLAIMLACLILPLSAHAVDYYVAPNGNDGNNGLTVEAAFLTISQALLVSNGGDTVFIRAGNYSGEKNRNLKPKSGNLNSYTTIVRYPGDSRPVISASGITPVFNISNDYIHLQGLDLKDGNGNEKGSILIGELGFAEHILIDDSIISDTNVGGTLRFYNPSHIRIASGSDITVRNCEIYGTYASGFKIDATTGHARSVKITNNDIHDVHIGVGVKWGESIDNDIIISYNKIYNTSSRGFYIDQGYVQIEHNLLYNIGANALFANDNWNGNNLNFNHNTIIGCGRAGLYINGETARNGTFTNNVIYNCDEDTLGSVSLFPYYGSQTSHNSTVANNLIFDDNANMIYREYNTLYSESTFPSDVNSIQARPEFVDSNIKNFALKPASPGTSAAIDGSDMGANMSLVGILYSTKPTGLNGL